jgi:hypothetical protein
VRTSGKRRQAYRRLDHACNTKWEGHHLIKNEKSILKILYVSTIRVSDRWKLASAHCGFRAVLAVLHVKTLAAVQHTLRM